MCLSHLTTYGLLLLLLLCTGCSRKTPARDYNFESSEALMACGNALVRNADKASRLQRLQSVCGILEGNPRYRPLAQALKSRDEQMEQYKRAVKMLYDMRYNDLDELVGTAEQAGHATTELLQLRSYHTALQTLLIYCNKRPYQHSEDMAQALDFLAPYNDLLASSPLYQQFFAKETAALQLLRQKEHQQAVDKAVAQLDWLAITYGEHHPRVAMQLRQLYQLEPACPLFELLNPDTREPTEAMLTQMNDGHFRRDVPEEQLDRLMTCQGLSLMLCWKALTPFQKSNARELLCQESNDFFQGNYCLYALKAAAHRSAWELTQLFQQWQKDATANEKSHLLPPFIKACGELNDREPTPSEGTPMQSQGSAMALSTIFSDIIHLAKNGEAVTPIDSTVKSQKLTP